ncbi:MAG: hypothetical protein ACM3NF_11055 [Gemmatimonadota bacterium]
MTNRLRGHDAPVSAGFAKRFILLLMLVDAVGAGLLFLALYVILSRPIAGEYPAVFLALRHQASYLLPVIGLAVLAYVLLVGFATVVLCVAALHKVAGPLYRTEQLIADYVAGEPVRPAFVREGDQAKALAASFNGFVARLREDRAKWLGTMAHAERLCLQDRATCRAEMEKALAEMEILLAKYR